VFAGTMSRYDNRVAGWRKITIAVRTKED